jgi:ribosomal protein L21E
MVRVIVHKEDDKVLLEVISGEREISGYEDGQEIFLTIQTDSSKEMSDAEFNAMVDRIIDENREALDYLAQ